MMSCLTSLKRSEKERRRLGHHGYQGSRGRPGAQVGLFWALDVPQAQFSEQSEHLKGADIGLR